MDTATRVEDTAERGRRLHKKKDTKAQRGGGGAGVSLTYVVDGRAAEADLGAGADGLRRATLGLRLAATARARLLDDLLPLSERHHAPVTHTRTQQLIGYGIILNCKWCFAFVNFL